MNFSHFFVDRPIFASVISIVIVLVGAIAYLSLPVAQYPEVAPPTVVVRAQYPGANAQTVAETVATPIEQEVNGVEGMLYMSSYSTSDGAMSLTITFRLGTNLDQAQVLVQNRVAIATPRLPEDVRRLGITTLKSSPDLMMVVHMLSPDDSYDQLYVSNYARNRVRDVLLRLDGVGDLIIFGEREYSLRVWLDPERLSAYGMTAGDVVAALREQNVQVSGGALGTQPAPADNAFQLVVTTQGRFENPRQFAAVIVKAGTEGRLIRLQDVARVDLGARDYVTNSYLNGKPAVALAIFQRPNTNALAAAAEIIARMEELKKDFPPGLDYQIVYNPTEFVAEFGEGGLQDLVRGRGAGGPRRHRLPPVLARRPHSDHCHPGVADRHLRRHGGARLLAEQAHAVRPRAGHRHRGRRRHRRGRECRAQHRPRPDAARGGASHHERGRDGDHRHLAGADRGVRADRLHPRHLRPVLQAVRPDHRRLDPHLRLQLADLVAGPCRHLAEAARHPSVRQCPGSGRPLAGRPLQCRLRSASGAYAASVGSLVKRRIIMLAIYAGLLAGTVYLANAVPRGFIPQLDQGYAIVVIQLPDGASCAHRRGGEARPRSSRIRRASSMPWPLPGFPAPPSPTPRTPARSSPLRAVRGASAPGQSGIWLIGQLFARLQSIEQAFIIAIPPPPVRGIGNAGGFKIELQERVDASMLRVLAAARRDDGPRPHHAGADRGVHHLPRPSPQSISTIDRTKARMLDVPIANIFEALQVYLGSAYVNDFNRFGRTWQVNVQADQQFRVERRGHRAAQGAHGDRRDGAARHAGRDPRRSRARSRSALQHVPVGAGSRRTPRPAYASGHGDRAMETLAAPGAAAGHELRVDRACLPAAPGRQHSRSSSSPLVGAVRLPRAGGAVRELVAAAGGHPGRADVPAGGAGRRRGCAAWTSTSSRRSASSCWSAWRQERHPDRRVRPPGRGARASRPSRRRWRPAGCGCGRSS